MKFTIFLTILAWFLFQAPVFQQTTPVVSSEATSKVAFSAAFDMLEQDLPLQMTMETDFRHLKFKRKVKDYQPARLSYVDAQGVRHELEVEVTARGKMRRSTCEFPPMKIKFSNKDLGPKTLKLVSICKKSGSYEQLLLREYVAYRLYNLLTHQSMKVQLVKMNYVDVNGKGAPDASFAFIIEHHDEMAERNQGKILEQNNISQRMLNTDEYERMCFFQFMIGNTDWLVYSGHNIKVYGIEGTTNVVCVPYDFDYSGFVNASYAVPDERLKLPDVTDRYYQGFSRSEEMTMQTARLFLDKKQEIIQYCEDFPYFDKRSRKHVRKYLHSFFDILENEKRLKSWILDHCDKWPNP